MADGNQHFIKYEEHDWALSQSALQWVLDSKGMPGYFITQLFTTNMIMFMLAARDNWPDGYTQVQLVLNDECESEWTARYVGKDKHPLTLENR